MPPNWLDDVTSGSACYQSSFQSGLFPDPPLWVDEWADRHMVIPADLGSAEPGQYRVSRTPFAKAVMRMGVPVSPRNIFPSNIQGMPTWYEARICEKGYAGRRGGVDMMVAMNPQTWDADVREVEPGGYLFYDSTRALPASAFRRDITVIGMPVRLPMRDAVLMNGILAHGLDYDDTVVPGQIVVNILHLPATIGRHPGDVAIALRWGYGSAFGLAHVVLRHRLPEPAASAIFGGALMTVTLSMFPLLGRTPPPWRWAPAVLATSVGTHAAYVLAAAVTDDALR